MTNSAPIVQTKNLQHAYKDRQVLRGLDFSVMPGEIFGLLGPNGCGKTTLMRILSTAFIPDAGEAAIGGYDVRRDCGKIRAKIGVVFQSPSLDGKLTVHENIMHQGHLYGLWGVPLKKRAEEMLSTLGLSDRARDMVEKLSGGLKRRTELAKCLLHKPSLLILDEPSTGLDPGARADLWQYLKTLRDREQVAMIVTTHLMEEAELCDRIAIMDQGKIISTGKPEELKRAIGADVISIKTSQKERLAAGIKEKFHLETFAVEEALQVEHAKGAEFVAEVVKAFPDEIEAVTFRKPTLADVFLHQTGHTFWNLKGEKES